MKIWLLLAAMVLTTEPARANGAAAPACAGTTTAEMTTCAARSLEQSSRALTAKLPVAQMTQWKTTTLAVCTKAQARYKDGSLYSLVLMGCADQLNRSLLNQFEPPDAPR